METPLIVVDLALALGAAFCGGMLARRLRQPAILGYFLAGVAISPFTPGPVGDVHRIEGLGELGIAFLMFALGVEFSLPTLRQVGRVAVVGGLGQILASMALGAVLGRLLGLDAVGAAFFGAVVSLSSTVVAVRLLADRGELAAPHGRIAIAMLLLQDLSVVPMMVILPAFAQPADTLLPSLGLALAKAAAILIATVVLGRRVVPWLLRHVASTGSRELFLLAIVALALGTALGTASTGLSLALGAFLAGLVVSESELSHQALGEITPLRDLFVTLVFVSVGMLIDPALLLAEAPLIVALSLVVLIGKGVFAALGPLLFGYPSRTAVLVGATLCQLGEFSIVLAQVGVDAGLLSNRVFALVLAITALTIALTAGALRLAEPVARALGGLEARRRLGPAEAADDDVERLRDHVVVLGYGGVGRELATWLERYAILYVAVEADPDRLRLLRERGVPTLAGDASSPLLLDHAGVSRARVVAVTLSEPTAVRRAIDYARAVNPAVDVVVRADSAATVSEWQQVGASEVVQPEFETALEFARHALARYAVDSHELVLLLATRRTAFYETTAPPSA